MRALVWPLFAWSAWAQQPPWLRTRQVRALLWPLFAGSAWDQPATVVAGSTVKSAAVASGRFVGMVTASHCEGGAER
jgi:hypothetical protein